MINGDQAELQIRLDQPRQVFVVPMPQMPDQVRFDPHHRALHRLEFNPGVSLLRNQLRDAEDVIGRILAARELINTGARADITAVVDACLQERHWGVRCEIACALGAANHAAAAKGLAQLIEAESEPRVLVELLNAARHYRDPALARAVQQRLEGGLRPLAAQAAYRALGAQRSQAPMALLVEAAGQATRDGRAQAGAFSGLGESRRHEAIPILQRAAAYGGSPNRARTAAVTALARIGKGQERARREEIREQLVDLLDDRWDLVPWAAARGLGTLGDLAAVPALEAFKRRYSDQEQASVERLIAGLREQDTSDGPALRRQVEELRDKLLKLEEQLQSLTARVDSDRTPSAPPANHT
jgi:HEAT repeat protein